MKIINRRLMAWIMCVVFLVAQIPVPSHATTRGSLVLTPYCAEAGHGVVKGSEFSLYKVGSMDANGHLVPIKPLENVLTNPANWQTQKAADKLSQAVEVQSIASHADATAHTNGKVHFYAIPHGIYLVQQTNVVLGYDQALPFAISIPMKNPETGEMEYDVSAEPKIGIYSGDLPQVIPPDKPGGNDQTDKPSGNMPQTKPPIPQEQMPGSHPTVGDLFQTGQLLWPIPFLLIGGVVAIVCGVRLVRHKRKR